VVLFLLVVTVILVHFVALLFMFISLHSYFGSSCLALAFIHLRHIFEIFILLRFVVSCLVLICFIAPLFIFLRSCFYKVIKNDIMCPFCIGRQLTSIQMRQFHSLSQTLTFCFGNNSFFGKVLAINSFLIIWFFDHQVEHLKKISHHLNKIFNLCLEKFQSPSIKFQLSNWCELIFTIDPTIEKNWLSFEKNLFITWNCFGCLIDNGSISTIDPTTKFEPLFGHYWTLTIKCHFGYHKV
jgi:hypothetical protein